MENEIRLTSVVRVENEIHILKCKIIDTTNVLFQIYNKTKGVLLPCYKIKANYGLLKFINPDSKQKEYYNRLSLTSSINRNTLIRYYHKLQLSMLMSYKESNC